MTASIYKTIWVPTTTDIEREKLWIEKEIQRIGATDLRALAKKASLIRKRAYQPYSKYSVGAAVLAKSGKIYASCNAETVSWTETDHAERSAISKAVSEGEAKRSGRRFIIAIAVSHSGNSGPCGGCRQRIIEHCDNALVMDVDVRGRIERITSLRILMPYSFTPTHLGMK
jgi:cytidine deaminase